MMRDDSDLLLIQNKLVARMMELYEVREGDTGKIKKTKDQNLRTMIDAIHGQIGPFMDAMHEQDNLMEETEKEMALKYYERWASIIVEMIPLLADAIALRLKGR